jgi:hypothetical protein
MDKPYCGNGKCTEVSGKPEEERENNLRYMGNFSDFETILYTEHFTMDTDICKNLRLCCFTYIIR